MPNRTLSELAELCGAALEGDGERAVSGPASLEKAGPDEISFLADPRQVARLASTLAGAAIVPTDLAVERDDLALLRVERPSKAFSAVVLAFAEGREGPPPEPGVHDSALVHPSAELGADVSVGPFSVVAAGARIGDRCVLHERVSLHAGVEVGADCTLHAGVVLRPGVRLGARCVLHPGVVLGTDGFGYDPDPPNGWEKVPQCGGVRVGNEVEIGANSCVDRGRFDDTVIGDGVKLDNLVQVGHNCEIGEHSLLCAQVGVAGSVRFEPWVVAGGQVGIAGHVTIGRGAKLGGGGGVHGDLEGGQEYLGNPMRPRGVHFREKVVLRRLPELARTIKRLEDRVTELEGGTS